LSHFFKVIFQLTLYGIIIHLKLETAELNIRTFSLKGNKIEDNILTQFILLSH